MRVRAGWLARLAGYPSATHPSARIPPTPKGSQPHQMSTAFCQQELPWRKFPARFAAISTRLRRTWLGRRASSGELFPVPAQASSVVPCPPQDTSYSAPPTPVFPQLALARTGTAGTAPASPDGSSSRGRSESSSPSLAVSAASTGTSCDKRTGVQTPAASDPENAPHALRPAP